MIFAIRKLGTRETLVQLDDRRKEPPCSPFRYVTAKEARQWIKAGRRNETGLSFNANGSLQYDDPDTPKMTTLLEAVSRAICLAAGIDPDRNGNECDFRWQEFEKEAKAAIEAVDIYRSNPPPAPRADGTDRQP